MKLLLLLLSMRMSSRWRSMTAKKSAMTKSVKQRTDTLKTAQMDGAAVDLVAGPNHTLLMHHFTHLALLHARDNSTDGCTRGK